MSYVIEDHFLPGMPQTVLVGGLAARGIAGHWTAGATGRAGALGSARFLASERERNASYHEIWWWNRPHFGVLRLVQPTRAAHSMNPNPPTWSPSANVRRLLGNKISDPNAVSYAVSFAGMPADLERAIGEPGFVDACARRTSELVVQETTLADPDRPIFTHGQGQPTTRYDWGTQLTGRIYDAMARFTDVPESHPFYNDIETLVKAGITAGIGGDEFGVKKPLTRGEMAALLVRFAEAADIELPQDKARI